MKKKKTSRKRKHQYQVVVPFWEHGERIWHEDEEFIFYAYNKDDARKAVRKELGVKKLPKGTEVERY